MLQQILQDMWVDPAILAELDDDQKQKLFCKMREEQVRRWRLWDQKLSEQPPAPRLRKNNKTVQFLNGPDGQPWTWVMGEHPDDLSIEQILELEAREKARKQAELEAQQLRLSELTELLDLNHKQIVEMEAVEPAPPQMPSLPPLLPPPQPPPQQLQPPPKQTKVEDDPAEMIYCSVDELRQFAKKEISPPTTTLSNNAINSFKNGSRYGTRFAPSRPEGQRDVLHEISLNNKPVAKVAQRVAQWEKRVLDTEKRAEQILSNMKRRQQEAAREAEEMAPVQEKLWLEQERRAKEAEQQIREIARRAREEHRRTSVLDESSLVGSGLPPPSAPPPPPPPQSREAVIQWYRNQEEPRRAGLDANGAPQPWFHGLISRQEAEARLRSKGPGAFLVRLSERVWGYAISYRDRSTGTGGNHCKHYLVDTSAGGYQFLGANQISHKTLEDLVRYHSEQPISLAGGERLIEACPAPPSPTTAPALPARTISPPRPLPPLPVTTHRPVYAGGARAGLSGPE